MNETTLPEAPPLTANPEPVPMITIPGAASAEIEDQRDQEAAAKRDAARQAAPFAWLGKKLAPFTPSREAAFHQHRAALNAPEFRDALSDSHAFSADAARLLWFLSHEPEDWLNFLAVQPRGEWLPDPDDAQHRKTKWHPNNAHAALEARIQKWMDETWCGSREERTEAYTVCIEIITRSTATQARPQREGDPADSGN